jgi:hypothetical protein
MKTIVAALIAIAICAGITGGASAAWDPKQFWEDQSRYGR